MASTQQAQDLSQFKEKKKAIVNELVKQAKASAEKNSNAAEEQVATVAGVMRNSQERLLKLQSTPTGSGQFLVKPPDTLGEGAFVHQAPLIKFPSEGGVGPVISQLGSKAAVVYGTTDKALPHLGYLLAWYKARDSPDHKVYVQAGDLSELKNMKWADIEKKLDASKDESYFYDEKTRAFAFAKIKYYGGNVALLGAIFEIFIIPSSQ